MAVRTTGLHAPVQSGLGGPEGFGETMVPRSDDGSLELDLSVIFEDGINYFGVFYDARSVFVNTNGTVSFQRAFPDYPTAAGELLAQDVIAPFWGDVDTRLDGEGAESGAVWVDQALGADTVTITWLDVGVYRRDAQVTNRFQLSLRDLGDGDVRITFTYDHIGWTRGSADQDVGAFVGLASSRLSAPDWLFDVPNAAGLADLSTARGNTGQAGRWVFDMRDGAVGDTAPVSGRVLRGGAQNNRLDGGAQDDVLTGLGGDDTLDGQAGHDSLDGGIGNDHLMGGDGRDTLLGGDGSDLIEGGGWNDVIIAGDTDADLRDRVFGGGGNDSILGGYGNDELRGDAGNDTISGGYGVDEIFGAGGNDVLTGQAWSDLIFGGDGMDFINGGFGFDRVNGGNGADRFYHIGVAGHGSDWIQDYRFAQGDVLEFGGTGQRSDFQVNTTETANAGRAGVQEAFVIYRPTGQILWALVDGAAQPDLILRLGGQDLIL